MTEHTPIQNPDDYQNADYDAFEMKLFSQFTSKDQLEEICMTLAHLPTQKAQELLEKFRRSERASEVGWLDCAVDEGQFLYLSPMNEQEERDFLALKVIQELDDETVDLQIEHDGIKLRLDKLTIRQEALLTLADQGEIDADETLGFENEKVCEEARMEELMEDITVKEKMVQQIRKSIVTERYQNVDSMQMRHIHFD